MTIGEKLQTLRLACKISQEDLGFFFKPSLSTSTISRIENGLRSIPKGYDKQMEMVLGKMEGIKLLMNSVHKTKKMRGRTVKSMEMAK